MKKKLPTPINPNLIYDVGMHKGEDTDFYLKKGFEVIGFEADPNLFEHCSKRFESEISEGKLLIVHGAIVEQSFTESNKQSSVKFFKNKGNTVFGTVVEEWADRNQKFGAESEIVEVPAVDFSVCLEKHGMPHYLKIDIEGMDTVCLRALLNFEHTPNHISIESEKVSFQKLLDEISLFEKLGYTKFKAIQQRGISNQKEPSIAKEGAFLNYQFQEGSSGLFGEELPNKWLNKNQLIRKYRFIFRLYKYFGDSGKLKDHLAGKIIYKLCHMVLNRPIPGWYDTHASK